MSNTLLAALILSLLFTSPSNTNPPPLCLPGVYTPAPAECALLGPAEYLTNIEEIQKAIDSQTERFLPLSEEFGQADFKYLKANSKNERLLYPSLEDAVKQKKPVSSFPGGFSYASYEKQVTGPDGKTYHLLTNGYWLRPSAVSGHVEPTDFRGVLIPDGTPKRKFGWMLQNYETREKPGYYRHYGSGNYLLRYTLVEVFDEAILNNYTYYLIGPGDWVIQTAVALVYPSEQPPEGVENGKWVELNLFEQTTAVYEGGEMIFATLTTSGSDRYFTRPGLFQITEKLPVTHMRGSVEPDESDRYYLEDVPWTMYFDQRRAFHAEYWHDHLGYKSSHGCANLSFADAEWLYTWANAGDWVYVWDPSGKTPMDPKLFTQYLNTEDEVYDTD